MASLSLVRPTTVPSGNSNGRASISRDGLVQKIYEASVALGAIEDVHALLDKVCEICLEMGRCQSVAIYSIEGNAIRFQTSMCANSNLANRMPTSPAAFLIPKDSTTLAGCCAIGKEVIAIEDMHSESRFILEYRASEREVEARSIVAVPIMDTHNDCLGVMELTNHVNEDGDIVPFPIQIHEFLKVLASQAGMVLKGVHAARQLRGSWTETVLRFVKASESRDPETGGHVERIGFFSSMIYEKLGFGNVDCDNMKFAAMLHDIGKLAVPDAILKKPGRLTPEERTIMQEHAMAGYNLLAHSDSPMLQMGAVIAATHHEKWDGSGYPQGLKGEEIPLAGRIVALVDVFDALSSKRCYKDAWPIDAVIELIQKESGAHFDPMIVDVFSKNLNTVIQIFHDFSVERFNREAEIADAEQAEHPFKPNLSISKAS